MDRMFNTKVLDSLLPAEMAEAAEHVGVSKANMGPVKMLVLAILAGSFIALGAIFSTVTSSGSNLTFGLTNLLSGLTFSLGLILVVVGGAELFTGNNLMVMGWASGKISTSLVLYNWIIVYLGNMLGAFSVVLMIWFSGHHMAGNGIVGERMIHIAGAKCQLSFAEAFFRGILCNILVCLAIWLCYSARTVQGKVLSIIFPITAFVAAGFEHSVANMYFIPAGLAVKFWGDQESLFTNPEILSYLETLTWRNFLIGNLLPVTIGNIIGGGLFVGLAYWFIYSSKWTRNSR
jgi:formate/nitrite transporter